jgi:hypothetical protein
MDAMDTTDNPAVPTELVAADEATTNKAQQQDDDMESGPINSEETVRLLVAVVDERIASQADDSPEQASGGIGNLVAHLVRTEVTPPSNVRVRSIALVRQLG